MTRSTEVTEYIEGFEPPARAHLETLREWIAQEAPLASEAMAYGIPTWKQGKNIVHIGGFKAHVGLYPGPKAVEAFAAKLRPYKTAKGTVQFALNEPLPESLVRDMVRWCVSTYATDTSKKK